MTRSGADRRFVDTLGWTTLIISILLLSFSFIQILMTYNIATSPEIVDSMDASGSRGSGDLIRKHILGAAGLPAAILTISTFAVALSIGLMKRARWGRWGLICLFLLLVPGLAGVSVMWTMRALEQMSATATQTASYAGLLLTLLFPLGVVASLLFAVRRLLSEGVSACFDKDRQL